MTWSLLALPPVPHEAVEALFADSEVEVVRLPERSQDAVRDLLPDVDLVLSDWSPQLRVDDAGPRVCFVQQPASGNNGVDSQALARAGVPLANCPGGNALSVAEWCVSATLALLRRTVQADAAVRAGRWPQAELRGQELAGRSVGLVGMGSIGRAAAPLFTAFGCDVRYWSRTRRADAPVPYADLKEVLERSDVVVVGVPLTPETRGLVDASCMAPGALLVNAARGDVVDESSLVVALENGRLGGAALDVFSVEPLPADSRLRTLPGVLLSAHMAGTTEQALARLLRQGAANLRRAARGEPVVDVVNGVDPHVTRRAPR